MLGTEDEVKAARYIRRRVTWCVRVTSRRDERGTSLANGLASESTEFYVHDIKAERIDKYYSCCPDDPYPMIHFYITFERFFIDYLITVLLPVLVTVFCGFLGFLIPPELGERIGLGITCVLTVMAARGKRPFSPFTPAVYNSVPVHGAAFLSGGEGEVARVRASHALVHSTNGPMDQWTNGPIDQSASRPHPTAKAASAAGASHAAAAAGACLSHHQPTSDRVNHVYRVNQKSKPP